MAAYYLERAPQHKLNDIKLMKLIAFAERQCLLETTSLITGARFVSMQWGVVMSEVWSLMTGQMHEPLWDASVKFVRHIHPEDESNHCELTKQIDALKYLAIYEVELMDKLWAEHEFHDEWEMPDASHHLPEWDETQATKKSSSQIELETIFETGFNDSPQDARRKAAEIRYFDRIFK